MSITSKRIRTISFFLCMLLMLLLPIKIPFNAYDEGLAIFNAARVLNGDIPYKDFWAIYPPGQFYTLAAIFSLFGTNVLSARLYDIAVRLVIVLGVYFIANRTASRALSCFICAITALLLATAGFYTYAVFPALALGLLSVLSLLKACETGRRQWLVLSGALVGMATWFRWDVGLYAGMSVLSVALLCASLQPARVQRHPLSAFLAISTPIAILLGMTLLIALPFYGYVTLQGGLSNVWSQVVVFPTTTLHQTRRIALPSLIPFVDPAIQSASTPRDIYLAFLEWLRFYVALAAYSIVVVDYGLSLLRRRAVLNTAFFTTTALLILGVLLFAQALNRYDSIHILPSSVIAFLLIAPLAQRFIESIRRGTLGSIRRSALRYALLTTLGMVALLYFFLPAWMIFRSISGFSPFGCHSQVERAGCIYLNSDQEQAIQYIRARTADGEAIFVGNQRHDAILVNDIGFYFLADRPSATTYHELHPGVATTRPVQETILREIQAKHVTWIVLVGAPESNEANASASSSGVHALDAFIRSSYVPVAAYGDYEIWRRATG